MKSFIYTFLMLFLSLSVIYAINVGDTAPDFTLQSLDNSQISLSDYRGKVVYLFFLGNQCPPCESHAPQIESKIYNSYSRDDVQVLGIDIWADGATYLPIFKNITKVTFPLLLSGAQIASSSYDIQLQDYTVIVDQNGKVAYTHSNYPPNALDIKGSKEIIDGLLSVTDIKDRYTTPYKFDLKPNYPNPFNPETNIPFTIDKTQKVRLAIYDITGKLVKTLVNATFSSGSYSVSWNALDDKNNPVSSGLYFSRLTGKGVNKSRRIILLK